MVSGSVIAPLLRRQSFPGQSLEPLIRDGFLLPLHAVHPPPRYGIHEHVAGPAGGTPWAGYSEVLGRCITHALLDGACWLAHLAPGHMPRGRFTVAGAGRGDALSSFAGHMCLRFWDDGGRQPGGHQAHTPPTFGACARSLVVCHISGLAR